MKMWVRPVNAHQHMSRRSVLDNPRHLPTISSHQRHELAEDYAEEKKFEQKGDDFETRKFDTVPIFKPIWKHSEDLGNLVQWNYVSERGDGQATSYSERI
jgi:hypothetical protein